MLVLQTDTAGSVSRLFEEKSPFSGELNLLFSAGAARWDVEPISLAIFAPDEQRPELHDFQAKFDVVFVDGSGYMNLAADMCSATLAVVRGSFN